MRKNAPVLLSDAQLRSVVFAPLLAPLCAPYPVGRHRVLHPRLGSWPARQSSRFGGHTAGPWLPCAACCARAMPLPLLGPCFTAPLRAAVGAVPVRRALPESNSRENTRHSESERELGEVGTWDSATGQVASVAAPSVPLLGRAMPVGPRDKGV